MGKPSDMFEEASQSVETPQKLKPVSEERNDIATDGSFQLQELSCNSIPITNVSISNNDDSSKKMWSQRVINAKTFICNYHLVS